MRCPGGLRIALTTLIVIGSLVMLEPGGRVAAATWDGPANLDNCYQSNHEMAVELLIDRTASLGSPTHPTYGSDPRGKRVDFAQTVVSAMAGLTTRYGGQIDVQATAFGVGTTNVIPFTPLNTSSAGPISTQLKRFAHMHTTQATDYITALDQAHQALVSQAAAMSPATSGQAVCKVIVWLTDGQFTVDDPGFYAGWMQPPTVVTSSNVAAVTAAGLAMLCAAGGSADQVHDAGIFLFAVGLASDQNPDFSLLSGIAVGQPVTGTQQTKSCGANQAAAAAQGAFYSGGVGQLVLQLVTPLLSTPPPAQNAAKCTAGQPTCSFSFTTYPRTVGADFLLEPDGVGPVTLHASSGRSFSLAPGTSSSSGGVTVSASAGSYPFVTMRFTGPAPTGPVNWTVTAHNTSTSGSLGYTVPVLDFGIELRAVTGSPTWKRGEPSTATFVLTWRGKPLPAHLVASAGLTGSVAVSSAAVESTPVLVLGGSKAKLKFTPPAGNEASQATVTVSGKLKLTAAEGAETIPVVATAQPSIIVTGVPAPPATLAFGVIHAASAHKLVADHGLVGRPVTKRIEMPVKGGAGDTGTLCFMAGKIAPTHGPAGTVSRSCAKIPFGATRDVPLTIRLQRPWAGSLSGATVEAWAASSASPQVRDRFEIPVSGSVLLPAIPTETDQGTFWLLVVLSFLLALGIWAAASVLVARLKDPGRVKGYQMKVTITPGMDTILSLPNDPTIWWYVTPRHDRLGLRAFWPRKFEEDPILTLRARLRFFALQDVVVSRPGYLAHGSFGAAGLRSRDARIAHKIRGEWVFTLPLDEPLPEGDVVALSGDLFFFIRDGDERTESDPSGVFESAQRGLGAAFKEILERYRRAAPHTPTPDKPSVFPKPVDALPGI